MSPGLLGPSSNLGTPSSLREICSLDIKQEAILCHEVIVQEVSMQLGGENELDCVSIVLWRNIYNIPVD